MHYINTILTFTRPPQWSRGNIVASHLAGPGSIPGRVSFPGWGFFLGFSSAVRRMSGKRRLHPSPDNIGHHNHKKAFHTDANDLWCRHVLLEIGLTIFSDIFVILSIIQHCAIGRSFSPLLHGNGVVPFHKRNYVLRSLLPNACFARAIHVPAASVLSIVSAKHLNC